MLATHLTFEFGSISNIKCVLSCRMLVEYFFVYLYQRDSAFRLCVEKIENTLKLNR